MLPKSRQPPHTGGTKLMKLDLRGIAWAVLALGSIARAGERPQVAVGRSDYAGLAEPLPADQELTLE